MYACGNCHLPMDMTQMGQWVHLASSAAEVLVAMACPHYAKGAPAKPYQVLTEDQRARVLKNVRMPGDVAFDDSWWTDRWERRR